MVIYRCCYFRCITIEENLINTEILVNSLRFHFCHSLWNFPNSIERVGGSALSGCTALESVDFGSIIQEITGNVFKGCRNLVAF